MNPEAIIRTIVPTIVGLILAQLARAGLNIDSEALETILNGLFISGYYVLIRLIGERFPAAEWLLGSPSKPVYTEPA